MLGDVTLVFTNGTLSTNSGRGGATMTYEGSFNGVLVVKRGAFKRLVSAQVLGFPIVKL